MEIRLKIFIFSRTRNHGCTEFCIARGFHVTLHPGSCCTGSSHHPRDVAGCTCAVPKHITKYTEAYAEIAPDSKLLLIESPLNVLFQTIGAQRRAMRPAIKAIRAVYDECGDARPRILLHAFSNAGATTVAHLTHLFKREFKMPLPLVGLIFDSSFGKGGINQNYNSVMASLPGGLVFNVLGPPVFSVMILLNEISIAIGRYQRTEEYSRKSAIDEQLLRVGEPGDEGHKRICYVASKSDKIIPWEDVMSHAEKARSEGWEVVMLMYDDTPHCNHMAKHEDEYRKTMKAAWTKSKL